uniref:Uncharacterized protein n=1 Tax=Arundo donax TaxID=35708 RepID=A0A0A9BJ49_ARUDO
MWKFTCNDLFVNTGNILLNCCIPLYVVILLNEH